MAWLHESNHWARPLDCHEKLFQFTGGMRKPLEHLDLDLVTRLQAACKALRMNYPDIATELHENEKRYHPISDEAQLDAWCKSTFCIEATAQSSDELLSEFRVSAPHATCH
ncbi:hypothetical protein BJY01DRAFT_256197 [Aspergillus pseudoustus]|uniref:Uncharacterized protein n=1 Tax=Aspergillus pseudoustus TaxID=1810923 RepID=A0ABR4IDJ4_9EURO